MSSKRRLEAARNKALGRADRISYNFALERDRCDQLYRDLSVERANVAMLTRRLGETAEVLGEERVARVRAEEQRDRAKAALRGRACANCDRIDYSVGATEPTCNGCSIHVALAADPPEEVEGEPC